MGLSQSLPIVVQRCYDLIHQQTSEFEIVEQPELHMHPAAHGDLADLFVSGAKNYGRFIIKTHSENFLLRLRRRVAEFQVDPNADFSLNPDNLIFYWLDQTETEHKITQIYIDRDGATFIKDQGGEAHYYWPTVEFNSWTSPTWPRQRPMRPVS